jgi:hypothetical protein
MKNCLFVPFIITSWVLPISGMSVVSGLVTNKFNQNSSTPVQYSNIQAHSGTITAPSGVVKNIGTTGDLTITITGGHMALININVGGSLTVNGEGDSCVYPCTVNAKHGISYNGVNVSGIASEDKIPLDLVFSQKKQPAIAKKLSVSFERPILLGLTVFSAYTLCAYNSFHKPAFFIKWAAGALGLFWLSKTFYNYKTA